MLDLPPRSAQAPTGTEFIRSVSTLGLEERERAVLEQVLAGNVPEFYRKFCPVNLSALSGGERQDGTIFVAPDYLAIGSDADSVLTPVSLGTAQRIADRLGCLLPTRKMVDAIYAAAELKLSPAPIPPSAAMTTCAVFLQHSGLVHTERVSCLSEHPLGALVAGTKKDVVISTRLAGLTNRVAIYGWHQTNGVPIQPLYLGHASSWVDYSHGLRLVRREMVLNAHPVAVPDVLADPRRCGLLSDEGVINPACYATNGTSQVPEVKIDLPWPEQFSVSPHFGEMIREIRLPDARLLLNAPARESLMAGRTVRLIFYALPNGSTIEQTIGQAAKPGGDWRSDIQHIGAQTRFLRALAADPAIVVAYLEAGNKSWPAWRQRHDPSAPVRLLEAVSRIFSAFKLEVILAGHSGGGSLVFGYLNAVESLPEEVSGLAFLDSNYAYESRLHAAKLERWLAASERHHLCVLAYHDSVALLNGKSFVTESGGTWGRSHVMLTDLGARFSLTSRTNGPLESYSALGGRIQFLLHENPERKILHTVQVERNGFIHGVLAGTPNESRGYEYFGERAYTKWIADD